MLGGLAACVYLPACRVFYVVCWIARVRLFVGGLDLRIFVMFAVLIVGLQLQRLLAMICG